MNSKLPVKWPTNYERIGLWLLLVVMIVFAGVVEYRAAFRKQPMTDADVYFRTAWAVRANLDIYQVMDANGWHFQYPPFFAVVMLPLADAPGGWSHAGMLPYPVSVAIWFFFSAACLALGLHWLACALEPALERALGVAMPRGSVSWWRLRLIPFFVCLISIGRTLSRGQISLLVLMLFCAMAALLARKRSAWAGFCLGAAISIKIIPGFLLLYGIARRDWRFLAGSAAGVVVCGLLVPAAAMGPARTVAAYKEYYSVMLSPALTGGANTSRGQELLNANGTDSQAFKAVINNMLHASTPRGLRPTSVPDWVKAAHLLLAALFTGATMWAGWRSRPDDVISNFLLIGCLLVVMIPSSPVSHTHYYTYVIPLVMALVAHAWERHRAARLGAGWKSLFAAHVLLNFVCLPVGWVVLKDLGFSLYGALIVWAGGIYALRQRAATPEAKETTETPPPLHVPA